MHKLWRSRVATISAQADIQQLSWIWPMDLSLTVAAILL